MKYGCGDEWLKLVEKKTRSTGWNRGTKGSYSNDLEKGKTKLFSHIRNNNFINNLLEGTILGKKGKGNGTMKNRYRL